jgi:hypothetical protein
MNTGNECGGSQGSGADNAYQQDMRAEYAKGAADALRAVMDAFGRGVATVLCRRRGGRRFRSGTVTASKAADLPAGSVVATDDVAYLRALDGIGVVWRSTWGFRLDDDHIQRLLDNGAVVLREGI